MKTIFSFLLSLTLCYSVAQRPAADVIKTSKGDLSIQPINHATLAFTWNGKTVYTDPNGGKAYEGMAAPDLIFVTDIHGDHFSPETLQAVSTDKTIIIVPQAAYDKLSDVLKTKAVVLTNGQTINKLDIAINAIPMYNLPDASNNAMHTKGRGNGYVLTFGNKTIYISGDTAGIPEMRSLKNIDVAFVCMNLPYTMEINEAASAVLDFKPKIVYPYHYRGQNGLSDTEAFKKLVNEGNKDIEVRLRDWYGK
ncbi:MBL fold metallo-hydrolase [soil metagenome]